MSKINQTPDSSCRRFLFLTRVALVLCLILSPALVLAGQANIFIYHRFDESRYPSTNISLDDFQAQLEELKQHNIQVIGLGDLVELLRSGRPLSQDYAVLTVDDGYRSFLTGAMPLLRKYGYPVTLFVNTDAVGGHGYLDWSELTSLKKEGVELGNHTASHPHMTDLLVEESTSAWRERLRSDLEKSGKAFQKNLGLTPELFAYPYGEYSPEVQALVRELGFKAAMAQQSGVVDTGADLFALPRFPMGGPYTGIDQFRSKLQMHPLPVTRLGPATTLVSDRNPPLLELRIDPALIDLKRLSCYVSGQDQADISIIDAETGHIQVQAQSPLQGRRSKYTLTAPGKTGGWYWFSQLWIRPEIEEGGY